MFQSSPDPKAGCYLLTPWLVKMDTLVSILTRPEGRVLLTSTHIIIILNTFQSSPDPKAGCYHLKSFVPSR